MESPPPAVLPSLAPSGSNVPLNFDPPPQNLPFTDAQVDEYREQDRWLPIANVARIMKNSLPQTAKVSKEAKECVQECVSEFISFITSEAAEKCINEKRKTINGEDILTSMRALGFDNYTGVLNIYLTKYREHQLTQLNNRKGPPGVEEEAVNEEDENEAAKKKRRKNPPGPKKKSTVLNI